ncbi:hypothetical protein [Fusibacter sp. 3D3]|uniref:hypothetical protein n=1 Tax=Fusibacter sp. 3D3 TaxID=1048380 RepID=UPI000853B062|nr:hypothetical protein [Fusibacter sp. 3D3]GAU77047.1 hypothetical protein F3D3_1646 [Fusibacter sp. 3D3]
MKIIRKYIEDTSRFKKISDALFVLALSISSYTLWTTYTTKVSNVCPINANQDMYYLSIGLLMVAFVITFFEKKTK